MFSILYTLDVHPMEIHRCGYIYIYVIFGPLIFNKKIKPIELKNATSPNNVPAGKQT